MMGGLLSSIPCRGVWPPSSPGVEGRLRLVSIPELEGLYMPKRVEEVRLRTDRSLLGMGRSLLLDTSFSGIEPASIRGDSLACWKKSREGVIGEEGEEFVRTGVRS